MKRSQRDTAEGILLTDQYELTMAQLYFRLGIHEKPAQFDHFFRRCPAYDGHEAGYCVSAGLEWLLEWMCEVRFREEDIELLRGQKGSKGRRIFDDDFLSWLRRHGDFEGLSLRAVPEGRVVHPNAPLTVVQGPLAKAQMLETSLLNHLNYQTLVATKAARIRESTRGGLVLEFGVRRAQERGASAGARAALIGGADFTSNVGISHVLGYPPKGTHAHSMIQTFMALGLGELEAFRSYAEVYPDECVLLVDTVDTLESGVPNAIRVFEELRRKGHAPAGVRLDSGDLAYLSIQTAKMLDDAGFPETSIVLSNNLDELVIWQIITQIREEAPRYGVDPDRLARRLIYGVGTRLITSWGEPALGGVYKLVAVKEKGEWIPILKVSESPAKVPNPGNKEVWRLYDRRGKMTADLLTLPGEDPRSADSVALHHPTDRTKRRTLRKEDISDAERILVDVIEDGRIRYEPTSIEEIRKLREADIERLDPGVRRLVNPHVYHVSLSAKLSELKRRLVEEVG